eukprot:scaffold475_cov279-Pinguiococcus_pyrenoidosus.AAC.11
MQCPPHGDRWRDEAAAPGGRDGATLRAALARGHQELVGLGDVHDDLSEHAYTERYKRHGFFRDPMQAPKSK